MSGACPKPFLVEKQKKNVIFHSNSSRLTPTVFCAIDVENVKRKKNCEIIIIKPRNQKREKRKLLFRGVIFFFCFRSDNNTGRACGAHDNGRLNVRR